MEEKDHLKKGDIKERWRKAEEGETKQLYDFSLWEPLNLHRRSDDNNYYLSNSMNFNQIQMSMSAVFPSFIAEHLQENLQYLTRGAFKLKIHTYTHKINRYMSSYHQRRADCLQLDEVGCSCERWLLRLCPLWCSDNLARSSAPQNATDHHSDPNL